MKQKRASGIVLVAVIALFICMGLWIHFHEPSPVTGLMLIIFGVVVSAAGIRQLLKRQVDGIAPLAYGIGQVLLGLADCRLVSPIIEANLHLSGATFANFGVCLMIVVFMLPLIVGKKF